MSHQVEYRVVLKGHPSESRNSRGITTASAHGALQVAQDATKYFSWSIARVDKIVDGERRTEFSLTYDADLGEHVSTGSYPVYY